MVRHFCSQREMRIAPVARAKRLVVGMPSKQRNERQAGKTSWQAMGHRCRRIGCDIIMCGRHRKPARESRVNQRKVSCMRKKFRDGKKRK